MYSPSTNPETPDQWEGATTRSLQLMREYDQRNNTTTWYDKTGRAPITIKGVRQKTIGVRGLGDETNPYIVGYITPDDEIVPIGSDVPVEDALAEIEANAAEADEGWGDDLWGDATGADAIANPDAAAARDANAAKIDGGTSSGATLDDVSIPAPDGSTSSGSSREWIDYGDDDWSGSRRSSGWRDYGDDDFESDYEFTAADFLDAADGDYAKAEMMARFANRKRKRRSGESNDSGSFGGMWPGFPFNRPPSPIREHVLTALRESMAASRQR